MIGIVGKLVLLVAFISTIISGILYFRDSAVSPHDSVFRRWASRAWMLSAACTIGAFGLLIFLDVTSQFQYAYVYDHSSLDLPLHFKISSSWAGQEGSFLLWIVMNALVGLAVMRFAGDYKAPVLCVIAFCQVFLLTMVMGLDFGMFELGVSPFQTLVEKYPLAPMIQAGVIPTDGKGLNELLQNYWMVIHPPVLFSGFAAMIVPFAFAVTALWKRKYTQWVKPALPWAIFGLLALGVGIMMGGYWAYETLSFGGYWAWDPVENSSLVPWIVGIAGLHTMIIQKRSGHSQKASLFFAVLAYMLVIYSTFLTRSGILGDTSVHAFVDLGLYNQLLIWILAMGGVSLGLFIYRYKELPVPPHEPNMLSREFMTFAGAMILAAVAAVILLGTSAPIIGRIFRDQPSTVPLVFYNKWTLPLMVVAVFLAGLGQVFWWNRMTVENINKVLLKPLALAVASTLMILLFTPFAERAKVMTLADSSSPVVIQNADFIGIGALWAEHSLGLLLLLMTFVGLFALFGNAMVMWRVARGNLKMIGGSVGHVGFAIMILGIVASSGFSRPIVRTIDPETGLVRDNFVLERDQTRRVGGYSVKYAGRSINTEGKPTYELAFVAPGGTAFTANPVAYQGINGGQSIQHPDIIGFLNMDLFVAVTPSSFFDSDNGTDGSVIGILRGQSRNLSDGKYQVLFTEYDLDVTAGHSADSTEVVVGAKIRVTESATGIVRELTPVYQILNNRTVVAQPVVIEEWSLSFAFRGMNVDDGSIELAVSGSAFEPEDWIVVQAYEKPLISLVWIGFIILMIGFCISIYRRTLDQKLALRRARV